MILGRWRKEGQNSKTAWDTHDLVSKQSRSKVTSLNKIVGAFNQCSCVHWGKREFD